MLLRSITKHVKDQNWFAVFLDFFIVVAGILIAFQITNWNEARLDQEAYEQAHNRMVIEAKGNIETLDHTLKLNAPMIENFKNAIDDIKECREGEAAKERIDLAIESLRVTMSPTYHNTAISHLTTSERLLERQSTERREQYLEYAKSLSARMKWSQNMFENMEARAYDLHPFLEHGSFKLKADNIDWEDDILGDYRPIMLVVEPSIACQDGAFRKLFYEWEDGHAYQINLMTKVIADTKIFLEELGEHQAIETSP